MTTVKNSIPAKESNKAASSTPKQDTKQQSIPKPKQPAKQTESAKEFTPVNKADIYTFHIIEFLRTLNNTKLKAVFKLWKVESKHIQNACKFFKSDYQERTIAEQKKAFKELVNTSFPSLEKAVSSINDICAKDFFDFINSLKEEKASKKETKREKAQKVLEYLCDSKQDHKAELNAALKSPNTDKSIKLFSAYHYAELSKLVYTVNGENKRFDFSQNNKAYIVKTYNTAFGHIATVEQLNNTDFTCYDMIHKLASFAVNNTVPNMMFSTPLNSLLDDLRKNDSLEELQDVSAFTQSNLLESKELSMFGVYNPYNGIFAKHSVMLNFGAMTQYVPLHSYDDLSANEQMNIDSRFAKDKSANILILDTNFKHPMSLNYISELD